MKTSLEHLPARKREELRAIVEIALEVVRPEMVILFGSYARGDWVEDEYGEGHITYSYRSDYDLLLITAEKGVSRNIPMLFRFEDLIRQDKRVRTPVSPLIDSLGFVNEKLDEARYFYADIRREGILLHDSGRAELHPVGKPDRAKLKRMAEEDLAGWTGKAETSLLGYRFYLGLGEDHLYLNKAAFELHQAAEALLTAIQLVFTGYRPKTHDLEKLLGYSARCEPRLLAALPLGTEEGKRLFELLRKAYVDARYRRSYRITQQELGTLAGWIRELDRTVRASCERRIGEMR